MAGAHEPHGLAACANLAVPACASTTLTTMLTKATALLGANPPLTHHKHQLRMDSLAKRPPPAATALHILCVEHLSRDWEALVRALEPNATAELLALANQTWRNTNAARHTWTLSISAADQAFVRDVLFPADTALWQRLCNGSRSFQPILTSQNSLASSRCDSF